MYLILKKMVCILFILLFVTFTVAGTGGGGGVAGGPEEEEEEIDITDLDLIFDLNIDEAHLLLLDEEEVVRYDGELTDGQTFKLAFGNYTWTITADNHLEEEGFVELIENTTLSINMFAITTLILLGIIGVFLFMKFTKRRLRI